jgi:hypothetical protein
MTLRLASVVQYQLTVDHGMAEGLENKTIMRNLANITQIGAMRMAKRKIDGLTENEFDTLILVKGLVEHGWSFNKVGLVIAKSPHTVKSLYEKALRLNEDGKLQKTASSERAIRIEYVGGPQELEEIEGGLIDRQYGRRPIGHKSDE